MTSVFRILTVLAFGLALVAGAETHAPGNKTDGRYLIPKDTGARWSYWNQVRSQFAALAKSGQKEFATRLIQTHSLTTLPKLDDSKPGPWVEVTSGLTPAESARATLRLNLKSVKQGIIEKLEDMLAENPPLPTPSIDPREATEALADIYIRAVDEFLATHPGAKPKLGSRNIIADATGLQNEFNAPWCADWAAGMMKSVLDDIPGSHPINQVFRFDWDKRTRSSRASSRCSTTSSWFTRSADR